MSVGTGAVAELEAEKLKAAVEAILGPNKGVRLRTNMMRLEIQGISDGDGRQEIPEERPERVLNPLNY